MGRKYRIGQAAEKLGLNPSVLRYWESEFPQLEPIRTRKGQRLYSEEHIALLTRIRTMLHEDGLTIEGARKRLEQDGADAGPEADAAAPGSIPGDGGLKREVVQELQELRRLLKG